MLASLISAMTLVPLFFHLFKPKEKKELKINDLLDGMRAGYDTMERKLLHHKKLCVLVSVLLLVLSFFLTHSCLRHPHIFLPFLFSLQTLPCILCCALQIHGFFFFVVTYILMHLMQNPKKNTEKYDKSVFLPVFIPLTSIFIMFTFISIGESVSLPSSLDWMVVVSAVFFTDGKSAHV